MKPNMLRPFSRADVASGTRTASSTSAALYLPKAATYQWILGVSAISGVDTTLDVGIQTTPDNGTTYYDTGPTFKQWTTAMGAGQDIIRVQPSQGQKESGAEWASWTALAGGTIVQNLILTRLYKVRWTIAGANPSVTFVVWLLAQPLGS